ncbi:hypothetical protein F5Y15DRAFT_419899 [Xylariaceae sp. FL0016]|nr:hypothetical protein F5Y15DRAFT_419899 [Xylariaceae sp. FL0016]
MLLLQLPNLEYLGLLMISELDLEGIPLTTLHAAQFSGLRNIREISLCGDGFKSNACHATNFFSLMNCRLFDAASNPEKLSLHMCEDIMISPAPFVFEKVKTLSITHSQLSCIVLEHLLGCCRDPENFVYEAAKPVGPAFPDYITGLMKGLRAHRHTLRTLHIDFDASYCLTESGTSLIMHLPSLEDFVALQHLHMNWGTILHD